MWRLVGSRGIKSSRWGNQVRWLSAGRRLIITAAGSVENDTVITQVTSDIQAAGGNIEKR